MFTATVKCVVKDSEVYMYVRAHVYERERGDTEVLVAKVSNTEVYRQMY